MLDFRKSPRYTRSAATCALVILIAVTTHSAAAPPTYLEDFTTKLFNDTSNTTANWDSVSGVLTLFPFLMSVDGSIATSTFAWEVDVSGNFAYVAAMPPEVIDITDPTTPVMVGTLPTAGDSRDLRALGNFAYVADGASGLTVINITTPSAATLVTTVATPGFASGIDVVSINVFVAMGTSGLRTYSITTRTNPVMLADYNTPGAALKVDVVGEYAYVADADSGLTVVDISNPSSPSLAGRFVTGGSANDVVVDGNYAYVADGSAGLVVVDITDPTSPSLAGALAIGNAAAIDVDGDYLYAARAVGVAAIDITDPTTPLLLDSYSSPGTASGITIAGDLAYLADGNSGLAAVRIADLVSTPSVLFNYTPPGQPLDVAVSGDLMFIPSFTGGVEIFDVSDPTIPTLIGTYAQVASKFVDVNGDLLLVQVQSVGLRVVDISDPTTPTLLGTYSNTGWSSVDIRADGDYVYAPNYGTGLQVIDISNPASPSLVATYNTPSSAQELRIEGEYAYVADYNTVQILNVQNPAAPFFVAQYDPGVTNVRAVAVSGDVLYVGTSAAIRSLDISNPAAPVLIDTYSFGGTSLPLEMIVSGDALLVGGLYKGFHVFDVSDPTDLLVALVDPTTDVWALAVSGDYTYRSGGAGLSNRIVIQRIRGREFDAGDDIGASKNLHTGSQLVLSGRITTTQVDFVKWELTANGGVTWTEVQPGADFEVLFVGTDLRWRATLSQEQAGINPYVSDLKVEWLLQPPLIFLIEDFPNDDGKHVRVHWSRSGYDAIGSGIPILEYAIYRKIDATSDYDYVDAIPATTDVDYAYTVPTLKDSSTAGTNYSTFVIQARTANPLLFYDSAPDSGYSVDNLVPSPPMGFAAVFEAGVGNVLTWEPSDAEDFDQYRIYRGDSEDFTATVDDLVHTTRETEWTDKIDPGGTYHYKITAVDMGGNESAAASSSVTADVPTPDLPSVVALGNNYPNPFNPSTIIPYALPADGYVSLIIYDAAGREVAVLIDEVRPAGRWSAEWNGEDRKGRHAPSGTYFYRLQAGGTTLSGKMVLLK